MLGNQGLTAAKFDTNIRALRGTVMSLPVTNPSTESDFYVGLPTGFNTVPTGVLSQDVVEPGYPLTSELWLDPNTGNPINGSVPPSPFVSQGRAWGLIVSAAGGGSDRGGHHHPGRRRCGHRGRLRPRHLHPQRHRRQHRIRAWARRNTRPPQ